MTAAPYCSTRTLIIGQRPLTNQRIIEEGLRIVFSSLSLFFFLFYFFEKQEKTQLPPFRIWDITLLWWYSRVIFYDAIHFQNLFYDEETRNESLVSFLLQFSIEFKKKRKGIGPFIEWNIKCKLTFVKIRRSLFESNDKNCGKLYWDSKLKVGISDSRMFEKLKKKVLNNRGNLKSITISSETCIILW